MVILRLENNVVFWCTTRMARQPKFIKIPTCVDQLKREAAGLSFNPTFFKAGIIEPINRALRKGKAYLRRNPCNSRKVLGFCSFNLVRSNPTNYYISWLPLSVFFKWLPQFGLPCISRFVPSFFLSLIIVTWRIS